MQIQTVLGSISPDRLGRTLTHEHFTLDFSYFLTKPPEQLESYICGGGGNGATANPITLENSGFIRQYPYSSLYNIDFRGSDAQRAILYDVMRYREWGGGGIVENSTHGLRGDREFSRRVARETGVHVIHGTGHYIEGMQTESTKQMTIEQMVELYTNDILIGVESSVDRGEFIRCGVVGEVASVWPITDFEKRSIQAAAMVQQTLNCGVSFHPGRESAAPFEIVRLYLEAGGKADKCVMSHLDRTIHSVEQLLEFAKLGTYCQMDLFGTECSYYQLNPTTDMPSDAIRMNGILSLVEAGYENRCLMSHDIHTKHRLLQFGGHGYAHIINNILPRLLTKGLTQPQIDRITIQNPAEWLQFEI